MSLSANRGPLRRRHALGPASIRVFHADPGVSSRRARCLGRRLRRLSAARRRPGGAADPPEGVGRRRALARHRRGAAHRRLDPARRRRHRVDPRRSTRPATCAARSTGRSTTRCAAGAARSRACARCGASASASGTTDTAAVFARERFLAQQRLSRRRPLSLRQPPRGACAAGAVLHRLAGRAGLTADGIGDNVSYSIRTLKDGALACHFGDDRLLLRKLAANCDRPGLQLRHRAVRVHQAAPRGQAHRARRLWRADARGRDGAPLPARRRRAGGDAVSRRGRDRRRDGRASAGARAARPSRPRSRRSPRT